MIIRIALMIGIVFFYAAILLIYFLPAAGRTAPADPEYITLLSMVHAVFAVSAGVVAFFISSRTLRKDVLAEACAGKTPEEAALLAIIRHRTATLLLMAPLEGGAFFGGAICMQAVTTGVMQLYPVYWLNALSAVLLIGVGLFTFPTREMILSTLDSARLRG
jgi:hypothetical protein